MTRRPGDQTLMTDTFSSGFSTPPGSGQGGGEPTGDVTSTLAELERKLRELERELTSIGRRRVSPEQPPAEATAAGVPARDTGRLVDERVEPHLPPAPSSPPLSSPPPSSPPPSPPPPPMEGERPRPTEAQLASLAELRRFRERLERFTKELLADYDAVLGRAMSGVAGRVPVEPPPTPAPPTPPKQEETLFEGRVELGVGPFYDIGSLGAFEQIVAAVPHVIDVSVRRFEASHAVVDLRLAAPVALVSELRRAADTDFSVRQVGPGRIVLTFDEA